MPQKASAWQVNACAVHVVSHVSHDHFHSLTCVTGDVATQRRCIILPTKKFWEVFWRRCDARFRSNYWNATVHGLGRNIKGDDRAHQHYKIQYTSHLAGPGESLSKRCLDALTTAAMLRSQGNWNIQQAIISFCRNTSCPIQHRRYDR